MTEVAPYAARWDVDEAVPRSHVQKLADAGYFGMTLPIEYGGRGLSTLDAILVIEEIAKHCAISARLIVDHNFGAVGTILNFGTEEQRQRVLPAVARGEKLISIGMTEPDVGSALTDLTTAARIEGDTIILNGRKRWITGAGEREYTLVYARFDDVPGAKGIGALLVEQGSPGYRPGPRIPTLGVRGVREGELVFEDAQIPLRQSGCATGQRFRPIDVSLQRAARRRIGGRARHRARRIRLRPGLCRRTRTIRPKTDRFSSDSIQTGRHDNGTGIGALADLSRSSQCQKHDCRPLRIECVQSGFGRNGDPRHQRGDATARRQRLQP